MTGSRRSTREIRKSLALNRVQLEEDLVELEERAEESLSPKQILSRHPAIATIAGVIVGVLVVRHPATLVRAATRLAQASAPFLLKAFFQKGSSAGPAQSGNGNSLEP